MKRRDWLKAAGAAAAFPMYRRVPELFSSVGPRAPAKLETQIVRLKLRHTWTTVMASSEYRDNLHLRFTSDGVTGRGEGAPIIRYNENAQLAQQAVESVRGLLTSADPWQFSKVVGEVFHRVEGQYAAKAAIDIALMDWVGQKLGVPLYRYFGLDARDAAAYTGVASLLFAVALVASVIPAWRAMRIDPASVLREE